VMSFFGWKARSRIANREAVPRESAVALK
jgi:hypothetical protein